MLHLLDKHQHSLNYTRVIGILHLLDKHQHSLNYTRVIGILHLLDNYQHSQLYQSFRHTTFTGQLPAHSHPCQNIGILYVLN